MSGRRWPIEVTRDTNPRSIREPWGRPSPVTGPRPSSCAYQAAAESKPQEDTRSRAPCECGWPRGRARGLRGDRAARVGGQPGWRRARVRGYGKALRGARSRGAWPGRLCLDTYPHRSLGGKTLAPSRVSSELTWTGSGFRGPLWSAAQGAGPGPPGDRGAGARPPPGRRSWVVRFPRAWALPCAAICGWRPSRGLLRPQEDVVSPLPTAFCFPTVGIPAGVPGTNTDGGSLFGGLCFGINHYAVS